MAQAYAVFVDRIAAFAAEFGQRIANLRGRPRLHLQEVDEAIAPNTVLAQFPRDVRGGMEERGRRLSVPIQHRHRTALGRIETPVGDGRLEGKQQGVKGRRRLRKQRSQHYVHISVLSRRQQCPGILQDAATGRHETGRQHPGR